MMAVAELERTPLKSEKLYRYLIAARATGMTTVQIADRLYGQSDEREPLRIIQLVARLRNRGYKIATVRDREYQQARYVLCEFLVMDMDPEKKRKTR